MAHLSAHLFGFPAIAVDGRPVKIERRKSMALLVYLLIEGGAEGVRQARAAELLWPGMDPAEAGWALRNAVDDLGEAFGEDVILAGGERLRLGEYFAVDVHDFTALVGARGEPPVIETEAIVPLSEAAALYHGDFLAGFALGDAPAFDRWQTETGEHLRAVMLLVLERLAGAYARAGQLDAAVAAARRWLSLDPLFEPAHRVLMRCLAAAGQQAAALRVYEDLQKLLDEEMDLEPSPELTADYQALRAGKIPAGWAAAAVEAQPEPAAPEPEAQPVREPPAAGLPGFEQLPDPATPFVGREEELGRLSGLLVNPAARMVTLAGPGGSGKTRLAIEAARLQAASGSARALFHDGIFFVPLASVHRADDAVQAIAGGLNVQLPAGLSPAEGQARLAHYLADRRCLLIVDNLEHLMPAIAWVADLLSAAPGVKLLITTRHRMNIPVEHVLELEGMPVPGPRERGNLESFSSVRLFLACAARTRVGFQPEAQDWPAIGRICQLVEGLPLGIELAAAWVRMFSPAQIADAVERSFDFLTSERGAQEDQHQSLRSVFEYSWRLLSERERSAYRKLAVLRGDFSPAAAAQVAGAPLPLLADLLDRSLLRRAPGRAGRYELHGVLAQFAREKLLEEPYELADAQDFHRAYFLGMLIDSFADLTGPRQAAALREMELEADNIELAWQRALEERRYLDLQRAALPLILFHEAGPRRAQSLGVFKAAHECVAALRPGEFDSPARRALLALLAAAHKRFLFGAASEEENLRMHLEAVECANRLPDSLDKAHTLLLANAGPTPLEPAQIVSQLEEAIRIYSAYNQVWGEAMARMVLGDNAVYHLKDLDLANRSYQRSYEAFSRLGHDWGRALCLSGMALAAMQGGNLLEAVRLWQESITLYERTNDLWRVVEMRSSVSALLTRLGRHQEALRLLELNIQVLQALGSSQLLGWTWARMANLARQVDAPARSEQLFRHALEVFGSLGDEESIRRVREQAQGQPQ